MARRRRRRIGDSQEHLLESGEDIGDEEDEELDQLAERMGSIEAEIREISLSAAVQAKDTQSMRARMEQFARELKELSQETEGEDELVEDVEKIEKQIAAVNQTQAALIARIESGELMAPALEAAYLRVEELRMAAGAAIDTLTARADELEIRFSQQLEAVLQQVRDELGAQAAQGGRVSDEFVGQTQAMGRQLEERVEHLKGEMSARFEEIHAAVAQEFEELTERLGQELNQMVRPADLDERLAALTGELEVAIVDLRTQLEEGAGAAQLNELRDAFRAEQSHTAASLQQLQQVLNDLGASMGDAQGVAERARAALGTVSSLEEKVGAVERRFAEVAARIDEAAAIAARVNVATRLVEELDEKVRGVGTGGAAAPRFEDPAMSLEDPAREESDLDFELADLLQVMIKHSASDLHLKVGAPPMVRLDGELIPVGDRLLGERDCRRLVFSAMAPGQRRSLLERKHLDFAYNLGGVRFRISAFMERGNISAAFRALRLEMPSLDDLGLPSVLKKLTTLPNGLLLVTGPTGSGKSTTLTGLVDFINQTRKVHIITIEETIEFYHQDKLSLITQREVGTDTPSFAEALRQALKQDPNVIVVGDLRDPESIRLAVVAAATGHLVLAGMSAFNAVGAIDRILDSFATGEGQRQVRQQLASSLRAVLGQRLLPRADQQGRVLATELVLNTPSVASQILEGQTRQIPQYQAQGANEGMITLTQALTRLYEAGLITKEEAAYHAEQPSDIRPAAQSTVNPSAPSASMTEDTLMNWL